MAETKRGPGYPAYGLGGALARAKQLFDAHSKRQITADEAVRTWGYKGLSGPSARALAGLRHYGLIEGGNNALRLSRDAITILVSEESSPDRLGALQNVARQPKIFQKIMEEFHSSENLPSDGAIRSYLLRSTDLGQSAASEVVEAFIETVNLAKLYYSLDNGDEGGRGKSPLGVSDLAPTTAPSIRNEASVATREHVAPEASAWPGMNFSFSAPGLTHATLTIRGNPPDAEAAKQIGSYLDLVKSAILSEAGVESVRKSDKAKAEDAKNEP